jgi:hypothetical protein
LVLPDRHGLVVLEAAAPVPAAAVVVVLRLLERGIGVHLRLRRVGEVHLHPQHCRRRRHHPSLPHPRS